MNTMQWITTVPLRLQTTIYRCAYHSLHFRNSLPAFQATSNESGKMHSLESSKLIKNVAKFTNTGHYTQNISIFPSNRHSWPDIWVSFHLSVGLCKCLLSLSLYFYDPARRILSCGKVQLFENSNNKAIKSRMNQEMLATIQFRIFCLPVSYLKMYQSIKFCLLFWYETSFLILRYNTD
jgi:hypothetical protein